MARKLLPSQIKYRTNNPTITFRVKKEEKRDLQRLAKERSISVSRVVTEIVRGNLKDFDLSYEKGKQDAQKAALKNVEIGKCEICGEAMVWDLTNKDDLEKLDKALSGWHHRACLRKQTGQM